MAKRRRVSPVFRQAVDHWHELRAEYEQLRENAFQRANDDLGGVLLNERGKRAGINPYSLFIGPEVRALAYASEELIDHWQTYPRVTFEAFERARTYGAQEWAS